MHTDRPFDDWVNSINRWTLKLTGCFCLFASFSSGPVHGTPGDYAWGPSGLDDIITQMLANLEDSGPPPAKEEKIAELPKIVAAEEDLRTCEYMCIRGRVGEWGGRGGGREERDEGEGGGGDEPIIVVLM